MADNSRMMLSLVVLVLLVLPPFVHSSAAEKSREAVHDDPFVVYPYRLSSTSPFGRIDDSALPGSQVPMDSTLPHFEFTEETTRYLKLELKRNEEFVRETTNSKLKNPAGVSNGSSTVKPSSNTTDPEKTNSKDAKDKFPQGANLPEGVRIDISDEKGNVNKVNEKLAFTLDENLHIVVENSGRFKDVDGIEFWVVAIQQEGGQRDRVVSNPLSFVVKIDHSQTQGHGAPVYAGIVVLVVCLFALLIPLTVRTKRRLREGKPLCACGSSSQKLQQRKRKEEAETGIESGTGSETGTGNDDDVCVSVPTRKQETEAKGVSSGSSSIEQGELALILEGRALSGTVPRHGETLQSHYLRSVSEQHFQPHWLDPHYKEVYERPVFATPTSQKTPRVAFAGDFGEASSALRAGEKQTKL